MPTISVIVPVYKVEPYLRRCVDSILNQTYTDFELILVDDGSPDGCPAICDEYAAKDIRVRVIHQENGGLSAARNAGLDVASGEYIYFVDSDDWIAENLLATIVPMMDEGNDLVVFGYYQCVGDSAPEAIRFSGLGDYLLNDEKQVAAFLAKDLVTYRIGWGVWNRMFQRDIIEDNHLRFENNYKIFAEDLHFSFCYCSHVRRVRCISTPLYYYMIRNDSIMGVQSTVLNANRMNELSKAILQHHYTQAQREALLNNFPIIHHLVLDNEISRYRRIYHVTPKTMRELLQADIEDLQYFTEWEEKLRNCRDILREMYSPMEVNSKIFGANYYSDGNTLILPLMKICELLLQNKSRIQTAKRVGMRETITKIALLTANKYHKTTT